MKIQEMKNAYGIKELKFDEKIKDNELKSVIIYSSNGTFKSSFAATLRKMAAGEGKEVKDRLGDEDNTLTASIKIGENRYTQNDQLTNFLIYSKDMFSGGNGSITSASRDLIISKKYKQQLKSIYSEMKGIKDYFLNIVNGCELRIFVDKVNNVERFDEGMTLKEINSFLVMIKEMERLTIPEEMDLSKIHMKAYDPIDSKDFQSTAKNYIDVINRELATIFFDQSYTIQNAKNVLSALEKNKFLNESRKIILVTGPNQETSTFDSSEKLKEFYDEKINEIINNNPEILEKKEIFEKSIGTAAETKKLKGYIEKPETLNFLSKGRAGIFYGLLKGKISDDDIDNKLDECKRLMGKIQSLEKDIESEESAFESALEIHKSRFNPPFEIEIVNKENLLIDSLIPEFKFYPNGKIKKDKDYDETREILSSGERSAFDIINLIVEYENLDNKKDAYVILDDVVETFDYSNRMAFIEYIGEMHKNKTNVIILTHNFEFYRTLDKKLGKEFEKRSAFNKEGIVTITSSDNFFFKPENVFNICRKKSLNLCEKKVFIASLPFVREISKYLEKESEFHYLFHIKKDKKNINISEVVNHIQSVVKEYNFDESAKELESCEENYYKFIFDICDEIVKEDIKYYDFYNKIILSIGCRLLAEELMVNGDYCKIKDIERNQTRKLYDKEKQHLSKKGCKVIEKVLLCSSEFIHINSFMYEPLIDIDPAHLISLYEELKVIDIFEKTEEK